MGNWWTCWGLAWDYVIHGCLNRKSYLLALNYWYNYWKGALRCLEMLHIFKTKYPEQKNKHSSWKCKGRETLELKNTSFGMKTQDVSRISILLIPFKWLSYISYIEEIFRDRCQKSEPLSERVSLQSFLLW